MTTETDRFAHHVAPPGPTTTRTLAELLTVKADDEVTRQLREDLESIRASERNADRAAAEVRLY
jgi:hypothetical protein